MAQPAAEARKADDASIVEPQIPKPPELMGNDACSQDASVRWMLQIVSRSDY